MAKLYRRGRIWWAWIRGERKSTKCTDKKAAELEARELERRSADPTYAAANQTNIDTALADFIEQQRQRGKAPETVKMHECHAGHFVRLLEPDCALSQVDGAKVDKYLITRSKEGASRSTLGKELTTLRGTLRLMARHGRYTRSLESVMPHNFSVEYRPKDRALTLPQIAKLMAELAPERAAVCAYIVATAADWRSVETAQKSDHDARKGLILVRGTKNANRWRVVPVLKPFERLLRTAMRHVPFAPWGNARRDMASACVRAGVPVVTPRDLRRSHATILRARGVEPHLIAKMLGHADSRMVERVYGQLPPDSLGKLLAERLDRTHSAQRTAPKTRPRRKDAP